MTESALGDDGTGRERSLTNLAPGLVSLTPPPSLDFLSPSVLELCFFSGQTKPLHVIFKTIC